MADARRVLPPAFFARPPVELARDLLGRVLVRVLEGRRLSGRIVETEAYAGGEDAASHGFKGPSPRNRSMFGPPGRLYVYRIYGVHHCLNLVCGETGRAAAVLIRALEPLDGASIIAKRRGELPRRDWARGPGRLCAALAIGAAFDGRALPDAEIWLEAGRPLPDDAVEVGPRLGVDYAGEAARWPWRFRAKGSSYASGPRGRPG